MHFLNKCDVCLLQNCSTVQNAPIRAYYLKFEKSICLQCESYSKRDSQECQANLIVWHMLFREHRCENDGASYWACVPIKRTYTNQIREIYPNDHPVLVPGDIENNASIPQDAALRKSALMAVGEAQSALRTKLCQARRGLWHPHTPEFPKRFSKRPELLFLNTE